MSDFAFKGRLRLEFVMCDTPCDGCKVENCILDQRLVKLLEDVEYTLNDGDKVLFKAGFVFDGASIPRICWTTIGHPLDHRFIRAALLHDGLYAAEIYKRNVCDWIFLEFMDEFDHVDWYTRNKMYLAVRSFGGSVWKKHTPTSIAQARKFVRLIDCHE